MASILTGQNQGNGTRKSDLGSPGLEFRVRSSDFLRISTLGFRFWFWLCQFRISDFGNRISGCAELTAAFRFRDVYANIW